MTAEEEREVAVSETDVAKAVEEVAQEDTEIQDEETALAASEQSKKTAPILPIAAGACALVAAGGIGAFFLKRRTNK